MQLFISRTFSELVYELKSKGLSCKNYKKISHDSKNYDHIDIGVEKR